MRYLRLSAGAIGAVLAAACAVSPAAATQNAVEAPSPDACRKTVQAMGASMGAAEEKAAEWGPAYHFIVRTNGIDYDVICDARTGIVKDVARRAAGVGTEEGAVP